MQESHFDDLDMKFLFGLDDLELDLDLEVQEFDFSELDIPNLDDIEIESLDDVEID